MADTYTLKINRRDGAIEVSGDREWVEEKLAQFADVYSAPVADVPNGTVEPRRQSSSRKRRKQRSTDGDPHKASRRRASGPSRVKGLDLAPSGKESFEAFVGDKQPSNNHEKNVLSVYYLAEVAGISPVTIDHVFTCYRDVGWDIPADLRNSLALTASRKGFLDTADTEDIKVEPRGMNHVERGLPAKGTR
jgi:hypothetical protein